MHRLSLGPAWDDCAGQHASHHAWIERPIALRPQPEYARTRIRAPHSASLSASASHSKPAACGSSGHHRAAPPRDYRTPRRRPHTLSTHYRHLLPALRCGANARLGRMRSRMATTHVRADAPLLHSRITHGAGAGICFEPFSASFLASLHVLRTSLR